MEAEAKLNYDSWIGMVECAGEQVAELNAADIRIADLTARAVAAEARVAELDVELSLCKEAAAQDTKDKTVLVRLLPATDGKGARIAVTAPHLMAADEQRFAEIVGGVVGAMLGTAGCLREQDEVAELKARVAELERERGDAQGEGEK